jgi:hypothetical protein
VVQAAVVAEEAVTVIGNGGSAADPASVRPRLAEAAAASLEDIRRVLLETATGANRNLWATINCKQCGRAGRYEITVPDNKVRLDAIRALLRTAEDVRQLSWDQMTVVFATQFANEIAAMMRGDGDVVLRARLAVLGPDERRRLREALSQPELG